MQWVSSIDYRAIGYWKNNKDVRLPRLVAKAYIEWVMLDPVKKQ